MGLANSLLVPRKLARVPWESAAFAGKAGGLGRLRSVRGGGGGGRVRRSPPIGMRDLEWEGVLPSGLVEGTGIFVPRAPLLFFPLYSTVETL